MEATDNRVDFLFSVVYPWGKSLYQILQDYLELARLGWELLDRAIRVQASSQHLAGFFVQTRSGDVFWLFCAQLGSRQILQLAGIQFIQILFLRNSTNVLEESQMVDHIALGHVQMSGNFDLAGISLS